MKRIWTVALALPLALALPAAGGAQEGWRLTTGGFASGPIEHVRTVPFETGSAVGGVVHEGNLYVSTWRSFSIYDVSNPQDPLLVSVTPLAAALINEGPTTNGEVLLLADDVARMVQVWDVRDKAAPVLLTTVAHSEPDHIWTCVLDCTYAYGSGGSILDLRDPADAAIVGSWRPVAPFRVRHSIEEVRPGLVLTGSLPQHVLDASDPENPVLLASAEPPTTFFSGALGSGESLVSYVDWPREARERIALTTLETPFSGSCNENSGGFVTYDTERWEKSGTFGVADVFRITENGLPSEGLAPANVVGCSPLGLDAHPDFKTNRTVAVGWAEHGVRLFSVEKDTGAITETGGFIAPGTEAFAPIWADATTLYVVDTARGLDVFRLDVPDGQA